MQNAKCKIFISALTIVVLIFTMLPFTVFAASIGSVASDKSVGIDEKQNVQTEYKDVVDDSESDVYLTVDRGNVVVGVPTIVVLDGEPDENGEHIGNYSVYVKGDIAGDETISVKPETDTVLMKQRGKTDVNASISQEKIEFDCNDIVDGATVVGQIMSEPLSAGSWSSNFYFDIGCVSHYVYYSSLERAAADANKLTTENADVLRVNADQAVAALSIVGDNATIRLMKDSVNTQSFTLMNNTYFNMQDKTVTFADGRYLTSNKVLNIYDGKMIGNNANFVISANSGSLSMKNVDVSLTVDSRYMPRAYAIVTKTVKNNIDHCTINTSSENADYVMCVFINDANSLNTISNSVFNSASISGISASVQCAGYTNFIDNSMTSISDTNKSITIIGSKSAKSTIINDCYLYAKSNSNHSIAFQKNGTGDGIINGGTFYGDSQNKDTGAGIFTSGGKLTINSTEEHPVTVFGEQWGLETTRGIVDINGGTYMSNAHPFYLSQNSTIKNAIIYCTGNEAGYVYCGSSNANEDAVINFEHCVFGNPNATSQKGLYAFVSQRNYDYKTVKEVNIKDCEVYQPVSHMFSYHNSFKDGVNLNHTKFNLYGNTKLYERYDETKGKWVEYSKEDVANYINPSWKTTLNGSTVGNKFVWSPSSVVKDGAIITSNLTDDANVYDYR